MYNPIIISNYFLKKYGNDNITPMKLVKLVYIAHGWYLGLTENALIDENPEAWRYGPVIPSVYQEFKKFGRDPIKTDGFDPDPYKVISTEDQEFLDKIWNVYGKFSAIQLSEKTHQADTPWFKVWNSIFREGRKVLAFVSPQIPDNFIKEYYQNKFLLNKAKVAG